ncbi:MAG: hypothetical protein RLZZ416_109 [Candidatus Parcubacteria bacterium]|jgi:hypothetical protein
MTIDALIMTAGAFVAVLPYLGFPNSWDMILFVSAGILIIVLGIIVRRRFAHRAHANERPRNIVTDTDTPGTHEETTTE